MVESLMGQSDLNRLSEQISFIDDAIDRRLAQFQFWELCLYYDKPFFTKRKFLKKVADAFQAVYDNYVKGIPITVAVSMPPRAGKSYITSLFCCWWLAKLPELSVMRNSCTAHLYEKFSYDCRAIIRSERFRQVFPHIRMAADKQNLRGWNLETSKQVGYFGSGVGGTIIGFGANLGISDDLYPGIEQALSPSYQESVHMWKQGTHDSRKEKNCPEIFIGTRWTKTDEIGRAIASGVDIIVTIPALFVNKNGELESFCEDVKTTAEYLKIKKDVDDLIWNAEYMQAPDDAKGVLFAKSGLKFYDPDKVDISNPDCKHLYVDPADTGTDSLCAPAGHLCGNEIFIPSVIFTSDGVELTGPAIVKEMVSGGYNSGTFEGNGGWGTFGKGIREKVVEQYEPCEIRIIHNAVYKATRIIVQAQFIKDHFRFRSDYERFPQYEAFMTELCSWLKEGGNKHDDAPDGAAGLAKWYSEQFPHLWK